MDITIKINKDLLDNLTEQAKNSPRLRMNYDLRTSVEDTSQRMLNAIEPESVVPIHRHRNSTEVVVLLRGRAVQWLYDDEGNVTDKVLMEPGGETPAISLDAGQWHRIESLESGTVIFEAKDGAFEPIKECDIMK